MPRTSRILAAVASAAVVLGGLAFVPSLSSSGGTPLADGGAPTDFIAIADTLSQPLYPQTIREVLPVEAHDGEIIHVEVERPDPAVYGDEAFPVILESSPYHGTSATRIGNRIFPDPVDESGAQLGLTGYFAPRGYAVAMMDLRGTGKSGGCLDHLGPNDVLDLRDVIEALADAEWSTGKVGMTGHSYVGATQMTATELSPRGLTTIIPSAGLASMYDHQFQMGVPYNLQYIGPMAAYEAQAIAADLPPMGELPVAGQTGDDFGNNPDDFGCGMQHSAALAGPGQATGQYELWHAQRDHRAAARDTHIPIFMIHGVNDNAARIPAVEFFFGERFDRDQDKVWIGQWDHGSTNGRCGNVNGARVLHPTCRFEQFQYAVHAWFDKHLKGMDVDTGPAVEAFLNPPDSNLNVGTVIDPETVQGPVLTAAGWSRVTDPVRFHLDASDGSLSTSPPTAAATAEFTSVGNAGLVTSNGRVEFASEPLTEDLVLLGLPTLDLQVSTTTASTDLVMTLFNVDATGTRTPINTCAIDPVLRFGIHATAPVIPGQVMRLQPQCFTAAHLVPEGNRLVLSIGTSGPHHFSLGTPGTVTVHTGPGAGGYDLPVVADPALYPDVALRED